MPSSIEQIEVKISKIRQYLKEIKAFHNFNIHELKSNSQKKAALERFLYLACDSMISLLEMYISYKKFPKAENYAENVDILQEQGEISVDKTDLLHKIISFRNILTHDYEKLDLEIIKNIVDNRLDDIEEILVMIEKKL